MLPARADVPAGTVTFEARNTGEDAHELVVVRAADPASLPLAADGTVDEDKLPEGAFVGEIEAFPAKQTCPGTFELAAGSYALFCNILETEADGAKENHYANGMRPLRGPRVAVPGTRRPRVATAMSPASRSRLGVEDGDHPEGVAEQPGQQHAQRHQAVEAAQVGGEHPAQVGLGGPLLDQRGQAGEHPDPGSRRPRTAPGRASRRWSAAGRSRWPGRSRRTPAGSPRAAARPPAWWPAPPPARRRAARRSPARP